MNMQNDIQKFMESLNTSITARIALVITLLRHQDNRKEKDYDRNSTTSSQI